MANRIRFYMDEHVPKAVSEGLRQRGVDVLTVQKAGLLSASDEEHLKFAIEKGRVIFTQDADFLRLHAESVSHPGIVYTPQQTPTRTIIRGLMLIFDSWLQKIWLIAWSSYEAAMPLEVGSHLSF